MKDSNQFELLSPLPPSECASRMGTAIDIERFWGFSLVALTGKKPALGWVTDAAFRIRKRIVGRDSFQRILSAEMRPSGSGTVISGKFAMHPFVQAFMFIWFGGVGVGMVGMLASLKGHFDGGLLIPPGMLIFGLALVFYGREDEKSFLVEFVKQTLNANEQVPPN